MFESPGGLGKTQMNPSPRVSVSVGGKWNLRICISLKFPGDAEAAGHHPLRATDYKITVCTYKLLWDFSDCSLRCTLEFPSLFSPVLFPKSLPSCHFFFLNTFVTQLCTKLHDCITQILGRIWPWMSTVELPRGFNGIKSLYLYLICILPS